MKNPLTCFFCLFTSKVHAIIFCLILLLFLGFSQETKAQMPDTILSVNDTNFFQLTSKVDAYLYSIADTSYVPVDSSEEEEEDGWVANYARWKRSWENKIDGNGMFAEYYNQLDYYETNRELLINSCNTNNVTEDLIWKCIGPFQTITAGSQAQGQINAISVNSGDENDVLVGNYNGGIWKSTDGGSHWHNTTDGTSSFDNQGSACIERMPSNQNIVFATTCKNNVGRWVIGNEHQNISKGIITSADGGETWSSIPFITYNYADLTKIPQLIVHPSSTPGHALVIFVEETNLYFTSVKLYDEFNNTVSTLMSCTDLAYKRVAKIGLNPANPNYGAGSCCFTLLAGSVNG